METQEAALHLSQTSSEELFNLYKKQRAYFESGITYSHKFRKSQLQKLRAALKKYEGEILHALESDFGKPAFESYASEIGVLHEELKVALSGLKRWMRPRKVRTPITAWPSRSTVTPSPKGLTLIIAPWNYPFQLVFAPLISALAAGNTAFVKPSERTPHVALIVTKILSEIFDEQLVAVIHGNGVDVIPGLMNNYRFDHVFFTGSVNVGRKIAEMAAPKLTPVTLELGGKSPCIVDATANLKVAAKRIAFGKWFNAGQTCIAPDYLIVHEAIKTEFLKELKKVVDDFYKGKALESKHYAAMVDQEHFEVQLEYLNSGEIYFGGKANQKNRKIEPTVITDVLMEDRIMQEEIFGPILPVLTFKEIKEALDIIAANPYPLAFYLFSNSSDMEKTFIEKVQFGGGAINNALIQFNNPNMPFGGIGTSGFGNYHGKAGFDTFSHQKSVMKSASWFDLNQKYPPYSGFMLKLIKKVMG